MDRIDSRIRSASRLELLLQIMKIAVAGKHLGDRRVRFAAFMDENPGCRVAVVRKTRVSLTESWLVTWENKVLAGAGREAERCLEGGWLRRLTPRDGRKYNTLRQCVKSGFNLLFIKQ